MPYADPIDTWDATKAWNQDNSEAAKHHRLKNRQKTKAKAIAMLGGWCVVCEESDLRLLTINHKNGDGHKDRQENGLSPGASMYRAINSGQRSLEDLDVRCYNHNILYEYELGRRQWVEG